MVRFTVASGIIIQE